MGKRQAEVLRGQQFSLQPLSPTPLVKAASPWRHAAKCGCAGVTGLGQVGGGVLVLAARRPFQTWLSESCLILLCLTLPFPFLTLIFPPSLYVPFFDRLPPRGRAIFRAGRTKARGPGGPVYDPPSCRPLLPPPHVAAGPRRRCPLWPGKQLAGSGKRLPRLEPGATLRARR